MKDLQMAYSDLTNRVYGFTGKGTKIDVTEQLEHMFRLAMKFNDSVLKVGSLTLVEKEN